MISSHGSARAQVCPHWLDRALRWGAVTLLVVVLACVLSLIPHLSPSSEQVRLRNALQLSSQPLDARWPGRPGMPDGFLVDSPPYPEPYIAFVRKHEGDEPEVWMRSTRLAAALIPDRGLRRQGAIQSSMTATLQRIQQHGDGYCGDYADVFAGLSTVAGIASRRWSFSFDGFGGHGHIFNEVWDPVRAAWLMLDLQHNFYPADQAGQPVSALEFRELLQSEQPVKLRLIDEAASFGFRTEQAAIDYYRRGLNGWYMAWGNNLFEQDRLWLARWLAPIHRAVEQLAAIASGRVPQIRLMQSEQNATQVGRMQHLKMRLQLIVIGTAGLLVVFAIQLVRSIRRRKPRIDQPVPEG